MTKRWISILLLAATYIGTVVGAGFASGKEIVTFFSVHGLMGTIGIAISGLLFIVVGTKIMIVSARIRASSYQELNVYLFGEAVAKYVNLFMFTVVICVTSVMLSGAGAVFKEQLGINAQIGIVATLLLCYVVVLKGIKGIFAVNSYIVPLMILVSLFVFFSVFRMDPHSMLGQGFTRAALDDLGWAASPFAYAAFNVMTAMVVLVPLGNEIRDEFVIRWGGILGGAVLTAILLTSHLTLSVFPETFSYDIPMGEIVRQLGMLIHILFLLVIYGEIFNTVVGNVFGIALQLKAALHMDYHRAIRLILAVIFVISQIGYGKLLTTLYPLFGYLALFMLGMLLVKKLPE